MNQKPMSAGTVDHLAAEQIEIAPRAERQRVAFLPVQHVKIITATNGDGSRGERIIRHRQIDLLNRSYGLLFLVEILLQRFRFVTGEQFIDELLAAVDARAGMPWK